MTPASGKRKRDQTDGVLTFPAPLLLPEDDLSLDPEYPPQSVQSWLRAKERNAMTTERNTVYVASPPFAATRFRFMESWTRPNKPSNLTENLRHNSSVLPKADELIRYLTAFYHGVAVKSLPLTLSFTSWEDDPPKVSNKLKSKSKVIPVQTFSSIGLCTSTECIRIRVRPCPDSMFTNQLNLNDLIDVAISILPPDAYALLLLTHHDLYEDDDDAFVCGRAYGGSRVAVISTARYDPHLDSFLGVDRSHSWPASHCETYMKSCCSVSSSKGRKKSALGNSRRRPSPPSSDPESSPLHLALAAHTPNPNTRSLHLARTCLTASHELAHCFGIEHCVYFACAMQGSASLAEDARQPPYLCPVDLEKILRATGADRVERYKQLLEVCHDFAGQEEKGPWNAFGAWLQGHLLELGVHQS
ncbi:MAG: hypothetical protein Q9190_006535 [Brigantiaea leucoxantha]